MTETIQYGEKVYLLTAGEGREPIRSQISELKESWDSLHDGILDLQRQMEVNLINWTSFEESFNQLDAWINNMEHQLESNSNFRGSLDENKLQLQTYQVWIIMKFIRCLGL